MAPTCNDEEAIFLAALELPPRERDAYLNSACAGDGALLARLSELLAAHEVPRGLLDLSRPPLDTLPPAAAMGEGPGTRIGPYKLLQMIGEGGMGVVYMAAQLEPVERNVALKIIKPGMDTRQVIARFEAERQALALMDHPNIARVLDGGTVNGSRHTPCAVAGDRAVIENDGTRSVPATLSRPYFVMELVKGVPITQYCDQQHLSVRQRLELFVPVCQAIHHAHQKGIIHRDVKPNNVLVAEYDQQPVPKVIDFGVAKALGPRLTEKTLFTEFGQVVGTIEFMSPEQAKLNQLDIDTRSDIYSLGVLLYELLTGTTPFDHDRLKSAAFDEVLRIIREEEPPAPSTRLGSSNTLPAVAANRSIEPRRLPLAVRGELDWIVMKALEKDRNRRYDTASVLAGDLLRYLHDEPVLACPPSVLYRASKFARRHSRTLVTAVLLGVVSLAALAAVTLSIGWALRDRAAVVENAARQKQQREQQIAAERQQRQSQLQADLAKSLADVERLFEQDRVSDALASILQTEALATSEAPPELRRRAGQWRRDLEMVLQLEDLRFQRLDVMDHASDRQAIEEMWRDAFTRYGIDVIALPPQSAAELIRASRIREQLATALDEWEMQRMVNSSDKSRPLLELARLADTDPWREKLRKAAAEQDVAALDGLVRDSTLPQQPPATVVLVALALGNHGQRPQAIELLSSAQRRHPEDLWLNYYLSVLLLTENPLQAAKAEAHCRAAIAVRPNSATLRMTLTRALLRQNRLAEAELECREGIRLSPNEGDYHVQLAQVLVSQSRLPEAEAAYQEALRVQPKFPLAYLQLAALYLRSGRERFPEAVTALDKAIRLHPRDASAHRLLARVQTAQLQFSEAIRTYQRLVRLHLDVAADHFELGRVYEANRQWPQALESYAAAVQGGPKYSPPLLRQAFIYTSCPEIRFRDPALALAAASKAVELDAQDSQAWQFLGIAQRQSGNAKASVDALERSLRLKTAKTADNPLVLLHLALAQAQLGELTQAKTTFERAAVTVRKTKSVAGPLQEVWDEARAQLQAPQ